ncbi:UNVERIFIED_CONTAM: hypothetical protein GTU68_032392 [Idotea baltica]|nr:hypothetical protein [Idotea baltica]
MQNFLLYSGNNNIPLTQEVAKHLNIRLGKRKIATFSDGECQIEILDNVRGKNIFILQSLCSPTNNSIMELMFLIDALRRAAALHITAIIPYFGYARQDRKLKFARVPLSSRVIADMLTNVGLDRLLTIDIHSEQILGFFNIPLDNISGSTLLAEHLKKQNIKNPIVVSPDVGGIVRARTMAEHLNTNLAIIDKRRQKANESEVMNIIGNVKDKNCIIIDDIIDTAGTLCKAAAALIKLQAKSVIACCVHPVLSGNALANISNSPLKQLIVTNSINIDKKQKICKKIHVVSIGWLVAKTIEKLNNEKSISQMFKI